ncbi:S53 family peptidase [Intrasporangium mesophilum]
MAARKIFSDSVVPLPQPDGLASHGAIVQAATQRQLDDTMEVLFTLAPDPEATAALESKVAAGEVATPEEIAAATAPDAARTKLTSWLEAHGFSVDKPSADGTSVYARSTVSNIAEQLQVEIAKVTQDGVTYSAARTAPSLPSDVGEGVQAILGLQPYRQLNKHFRKYVAPPAATGSREMMAAAAAAATGTPPYLVDDLRSAYGAQDLAVTGAGQIIAILIDTVPSGKDLKAFWARNGMTGTSASTKRVKRINVGGTTLPPAEGEETLDVEWSSGIAPDAKIRVYASGSLRFVDLDRALDRIIADLPRYPGMRQLSISLGLGETFLGGPGGEVAAQHQKFLKLAAAGVNVFVSSGDAGSNPDGSGHSSSGPLQVEYEASDPVVIGVGGTTLDLDSAGAVTSETAWAGSGGGVSAFFGRPPWQTGPGVPTGNKRLVPDVSAAADPNTGALVILHGKDNQIGGTSWSAPVWAGICALLNESRVAAGKPAHGYLAPLLYPLSGTNCFRDVTSGSNGAYQASAGYDRVTGLGSPHVGNLIAKLT